MHPGLSPSQWISCPNKRLVPSRADCWLWHLSDSRCSRYGRTSRQYIAWLCPFDQNRGSYDTWRLQHGNSILIQPWICQNSDGRCSYCCFVSDFTGAEVPWSEVCLRGVFQRSHTHHGTNKPTSSKHDPTCGRRSVWKPFPHSRRSTKPMFGNWWLRAFFTLDASDSINIYSSSLRLLSPRGYDLPDEGIFSYAHGVLRIKRWDESSCLCHISNAIEARWKLKLSHNLTWIRGALQQTRDYVPDRPASMK